MLRPQTLVLAAVAVASLLACGSPGTRGEPAPALGPYAAARTGAAPAVRAQPAPLQDPRAGSLMLRDTRRMCDLRGPKGAC